MKGISGITHGLITGGSTRLIYCVIYGAYGLFHSVTNSSPDLTQSVLSGLCMQYLVTLIMLVLVLVAWYGVNIWNICRYHSFRLIFITWFHWWCYECTSRSHSVVSNNALDLTNNFNNRDIWCNKRMLDFIHDVINWSPCLTLRVIKGTSAPTHNVSLIILSHS